MSNAATRSRARRRFRLFLAESLRAKWRVRVREMRFDRGLVILDSVKPVLEDASRKRAAILRTLPLYRKNAKKIRREFL